MHSKTRIAALIAALMFGAQAGVAALEETASVEVSEAVEQRAEALPAEPAATPEPAAAPERIASAETAAPPPSEQAADTGQSAVSRVRSWFGRFMTALRSGTPPPTFPEGSHGERWTPLPAQLAYFEQLERERAHLVARGDAFPVGSQTESWLLPAQVAYFDRLEQQRLASMESPSAPQAEILPIMVEASGMEVTMADGLAVGTIR